MPGNDSQTRHTFSRRVAPFAPVALALLMNGIPQNKGAATPQPMAAEAGFAQSCDSAHFPIDTPAAMDGTSCGISGNGGAETWQNEAKNNFCSLDPAKQITIAEMVQLQAKVQHDETIPFGNPRQHPLTSKAGPIKD